MENLQEDYDSLEETLGNVREDRDQLRREHEDLETQVRGLGRYFQVSDKGSVFTVLKRVEARRDRILKAVGTA